MSTIDCLTRAWLWLITLSGIAALVSVAVTSGVDRRLAGAAILVLALLKARLILSRYLGLEQSPRWRAGFNTALSLFVMFLLGLYIAPMLMG